MWYIGVITQLPTIYYLPGTSKYIHTYAYILNYLAGAIFYLQSWFFSVAGLKLYHILSTAGSLYIYMYKYIYIYIWFFPYISYKPPSITPIMIPKRPTFPRPLVAPLVGLAHAMDPLVDLMAAPVLWRHHLQGVGWQPPSSRKICTSQIGRHLPIWCERYWIISPG